eukprot:2268654-Rhodomonas_salina.2
MECVRRFRDANYVPQDCEAKATRRPAKAVREHSLQASNCFNYAFNVSYLHVILERYRHQVTPFSESTVVVSGSGTGLERTNP